MQDFNFKIVEKVESVETPKISGLGWIISIEAVGWGYLGLVTFCMT